MAMVVRGSPPYEITRCELCRGPYLAPLSGIAHGGPPSRPSLPGRNLAGKRSRRRRLRRNTSTMTGCAMRGSRCSAAVKRGAQPASASTNVRRVQPARQRAPCEDRARREPVRISSWSTPGCAVWLTWRVVGRVPTIHTIQPYGVAGSIRTRARSKTSLPQGLRRRATRSPWSLGGR